MCLWNPDSRSRQILAATVLFLTVASDPLTAVYIPLLILRLWTVRGWRGRLPAIAMAAGLALQGYGILFRHALQSRNVPPHYDPQWAFQNFLDNVAGQSLYTAAVGSRWGLPTASASHYVAWALTGVIVCIAALGLTNASWPLAVVAFVQSLALYAAFAMKGGTAAPRYEVPTLCLFVVTIAALANPAARRSPAEAAEPVPSDERAPHRRLAIRLAGSRSAPFLLPRLPALAVLGVVIACAKGSYSVGMHDREVAPSFSAELGRGVADCHANPTGSAVIAIAPLGLWHMDVPCALVRDRDKFFRVGVVAAGSR
jgi:hypothetical protein